MKTNLSYILLFERQSERRNRNGTLIKTKITNNQNNQIKTNKERKINRNKQRKLQKQTKKQIKPHKKLITRIKTNKSKQTNKQI